jgi:hypothetical protein
VIAGCFQIGADYHLDAGFVFNHQNVTFVLVHPFALWLTVSYPAILEQSTMDRVMIQQSGEMRRINARPARPRVGVVFRSTRLVHSPAFRFS